MVRLPRRRDWVYFFCDLAPFFEGIPTFLASPNGEELLAKEEER
jgi:hypothetical protein